jgi:hypothetical protein
MAFQLRRILQHRPQLHAEADSDAGIVQLGVQH